MSRGVYNASAVNNNGSVLLGGGANDSTVTTTASLALTPGERVAPTGYCEESYQGEGTLAYQRTGAFITNANPVTSINGISGRDFDLTVNGAQSLEQHSTKYGRKLDITSISNDGTITYGASNGTSYGFAPGSGTPVDTQADAAKDPYGTPPNFIVLGGSGPVAHSFTALTSF